ncbi:MAG: acyl-CoA thioesterase [Candidatus Xenobia bacterium]
MAFSFPIAVRFRDMDALGHVNNAVYFTYLEMARTAYCLERIEGTSIRDLFFLLVRAECDFRRPATMEDHLEVAVSTAQIGRTSFTLEYRITTGDALIAEARTVQACYDFKTRQVIPVPEKFRTAVQALG